jgi:hypothetical protein
MRIAGGRVRLTAIRDPVRLAGCRVADEDVPCQVVCDDAVVGRPVRCRRQSALAAGDEDRAQDCK